MIRKGKIVTDKETDLHKQAEEALGESEEKYRAIIEHMEEGYHEVDIRGNFTFFNESMRKIIGYEREELLGMNNRQYSDEENAREVYQVYNRVYRTGEPVKNFEWKIVRKDGDRRDIDVSISLIRDREGHPTGFRGIVRDTTDRKQGEEALRDANSRMNSIIEGTHVGTWEWHVQTGETVFNEVWAQIIGYTLKELTPISIKTWETFAHPDDLKQSGELLERHFAGELPYYDYECRMKHKDGHWVWVHDRGRVITRTTNGKPLMMFGTHTDISERKRADEQLHASLREKEILLSEIHHRVKNNMQVISGLLDLQARSSGNPELTGMLNESQSRIRSMALIHEKLYASKDFTKIDLAGYVRTLSQELFQTYKINAGKIDLVIQTDGAVYVDISKAIPCGLILNELLSNALKHAFPGDEPGEIKIIIGEAENAEMWISFRDNGLGLPNDVDIHQPRTVGLHLVNGLVTKQLDGQIEVRRGAGTEFQITIPYDLSEERSL